MDTTDITRALFDIKEPYLLHKRAIKTKMRNYSECIEVICRGFEIKIAKQK